MNLTQFCGGEDFFDSAKVFNSTNPEFSFCFQHMVFDLVPCVFFLVFSIPYYFVNRNSLNSHIPVSKLFTAKVVFTNLLWLLAFANLGYGFWEYSHDNLVSYVDLVSPLIVGICMALAVFFLNFDRKKGIRSSSLLTCYWLTYCVLWALIFKNEVELLLQNKSLEKRETFRCITFFISYACVIALFIMSFFVDKPPALLPKDPYADEITIQFNNNNLTRVLKPKRQPCPEHSSTFLSRTVFEWFSSMIWVGYKRPLVEDDLWDLNGEDKTARISRHFQHNWNQEKKICLTQETGASDEENLALNDDEEILLEEPTNVDIKQKVPSLFKVLVKTFGPSFLPSVFLRLVYDILVFVSPQLLSAIIAFTSSTAPVWQGYGLAVLFFLTAILQTTAFQNYFHVCYTIGMRMRSAVVSAVYKKAFVLSSGARKDSTAGEIVNLMSVDAQRFMDLMPYINCLWSAPFEILLAVIFLWKTMGPSVMAGVGLMILLVPINGLLANKMLKLQAAQMEQKDERIKVINEILNGIKVLKMYSWELSFKDKVSAIRNKELNLMKKFVYLDVILTFSWSFAPFMVSLVTFAVYLLSDPSHSLDAQKIFVSISLFDLVQFPLLNLPFTVSAVVQAKLSLKRLQQFLNYDELDPKCINEKPDSSFAVEVDNGTFAWDKSDEPTLRNISLEVPKGSLVAVVGQVGSGKSSLISCLLGDMEKTNGKVAVQGSVAYVAQQAWIQNMTLQDNILFGQTMNEEKYEETLDACELREDLKMFPTGDQTEIGEKGINLSGGQKQRVSIARAVYRDADVYLLDDPLSAVDAHVGKNLFDNVLGPGGCLRQKTRILVTHGITFLPQADQIIVMNKGKISEVGNYDELLVKNGDFAEFLRNYAELKSAKSDDELFVDEETKQPPALSHLSSISFPDDEPVDAIVGSPGSMTACKLLQRQRSRLSTSDDLHQTHALYENENSEKTEKGRVRKLSAEKITEDKLITTETVETGNIKSSVLLMYMKAVGTIASIGLLIGYTFDNVSTVYSRIWLSEWSDEVAKHNGTQNDTGYRLAIYGVLGVSKAVFNLMSSFGIYYGGILASGYLHAKMLDNIVQVPMSFFDTTPLGRIVNRFSKDIYLIDDTIPQSFSGFLETLFMSIATIFAIVFSLPIFGAVILPILILYWFVQRFYVKTSRQLQRLESISRSPIYSHFSETLTGVSTIRAYRLQQSFIQQNEAKVDANQKAHYPNIVSNRWLSLRLQVVGSLIVLFATIFAVIERGTISSGLVGLAVSYAMQITQLLHWVVRSASEIETNIVAVERVEEYANVKQEAPLVVDNQVPLENWPESGEIKFVNYSTRYRDGLSLVVHNINVNINGREKIGVVGRTGAGKSSLTLALFRIIEAAEGMITIDGLDIAKMGLHSLRSKLSIIPQDPVLFSGTLRMNLDPFDVYNDIELWDALEHSHLKTFVSGLVDKLEHKVAEGGQNLSVGQRQLVCLARALLRKSKILVLDEATATVDLETDDLIQATIRAHFADCTTFTIAHRLRTIMDSTRILVMDAGQVAEYDTPESLLKAKGLFYSMAKNAGLAP
ncbi:multidrug resistance-associated protein 1-like isoform X1 [Clavelina lepadiformis]|uniref:multidrug resistance-associated protein 1-like isoform X1 n=1 Tax=Clavelina lepadiformis TaxID=159417 RepID=UPI00404177B7